MRPHEHGWVHPRNRILKPNIFPGDRVRLMVGKDEEKYEFIEDEHGKTKRIWKLYTVGAANIDKNRLYLEELRVCLAALQLNLRMAYHFNTP
jgi:hypothetical protein